MVIVPNFLGFNGWLNKKYDPQVFSKHYLECMDKDYLKQCASNCGLENIKTYYYGKFSIWLENLSTKNIVFRILFKFTWLLGKVLTKLIPIESKLFSPYTILWAKKAKTK